MDFSTELLRARLRMLESELIPFYDRCFASRGFSKERLPPLPDGPPEANDDRAQHLVSSHVGLLLELACRPPRGGASTESGELLASVPAPPAYSPPPGSLYRSLGLDPGTRSIRVLEVLPGSGAQGIECALGVAALDTVSPFEALSYVWGLPFPTEPVVVNSITVEIGRNLHCALAALRFPDRRRRLWADALCIDQKNDVEKSWQVALMADIYRHAERSLVFLGEEEDSAPLFRFLNRRADAGKGDVDQDKSLETAAAECGVSVLDLLQSYISFAKRPWFTRVWVYQEFALAHAAPIWHCGPWSASNEAMRRDLRMLFGKYLEYQFSISTEDVDFTTNQTFQQLLALLTEVTHIVFVESLSSGFRNVPLLLYRSLNRVCTDPRDIVFGLREFFEPTFQSIFWPDYSIDKGELFMRLSAWLIVMDRWGDVFEAFPHRCSPLMPSWVRDFSQLPASRLRVGEHKEPLAMVSAIYDQVLCVSGIDLDEVSDVFEVDDDADETLMETLWHLDQTFLRMRPAFEKQPSVISRLDTSDLMSCWLMGEKNSSWTALASQAKLLLSNMDRVIRPLIHHENGGFEKAAMPPDDVLQQLPEEEAMALLDERKANSSRASKRLVAFMDLKTYVARSIMSRENLAAAIAYDHENLTAQLRNFRETGALPAVTPLRLEGGDLVVGPGTVAYGDTIQFLSQHGDAPVVDVLLEVLELTRADRASGQEARPPEVTFSRDLDEVEKRMDKWNADMAADQKLAPDTKASAAATYEQRKEEMAKFREKSSEVEKLESASSSLLHRFSSTVTNPFSHRTFFVTKGGLPGAGTRDVRGIRRGDKLIWLHDMYHPLVVRESSSRPQQHEIVGTAVVRGIMDGNLSKLGSDRPPFREFRFI